MYATIKSIWTAVISSFWFVPGLVTAAALVLAITLVWLELAGTFSAFSSLPLYPHFGPEGARAILSAIAGGMMTMASLVFSLTFVGLTLVSGQLGPRVFMLFMDDRTTQFVLGAFVGIFLFALIALANVSELEERFVPNLAVGTAVASSTAAFALVIFFVHHMARSIQADVVVSRLGERFVDVLERVIEQAEATPVSSDAALFEITAIAGTPLPAHKSGYIRYVDYDSLLTCARKNDLRLNVVVRPGDHITQGLPLAQIEGDGIPLDPLLDAFRIGPRRDRLQEATFEARALVDIALRALSPGINDPNTAVAAIDHISDGLVMLTRAGPPPRVLEDDDGTPRIARPDLGLGHYLDLVVPALLPAMRSDTLATESLIAMLVTLRRIARRPGDIEHIERWLDTTRTDLASHQLPQDLTNWLEARSRA